MLQRRSDVAIRGCYEVAISLRWKRQTSSLQYLIVTSVNATLQRRRLETLGYGWISKYRNPTRRKLLRRDDVLPLIAANKSDVKVERAVIFESSLLIS